LSVVVQLLPDFSYQSLTSATVGELTRRHPTGRPGNRIGSGWTPMTFAVQDPKTRKGDFFNLSGYMLACSRQRAEQLSPYLEQSGEVLPIEVEGSSEPHVLWNILACADVLDEGRSRIAMLTPQIRGDIEQYAFRPDALASAPRVFRLPQALHLVYASTKIEDSGDDFVSRYQKLGLTGLRFKELWRQDS
jgi:hypothetical protein